MAPVSYGCAGDAVPAARHHLKRTRVAIPIPFAVAPGASLAVQSGVLASSFAAESRLPAANETFTDVAAAAEPPADGLDLYDNIHRYKWRPEYMMAAVDLYLPESEDGEFDVSIRREAKKGRNMAIRT